MLEWVICHVTPFHAALSCKCYTTGNLKISPSISELSKLKNGLHTNPWNITLEEHENVHQLVATRDRTRMVNLENTLGHLCAQYITAQPPHIYCEF